jgi:adenylate cyclase class 2
LAYLETEVKFFLTDIRSLRNRIIELGADCKGRVFETNIRFEDKDKNLYQNKALLRLRKDRKTTLTFKSEPPVQNNQFKVLRELEVEVSDFSTMKHILGSIGFQPEQIYEKWRETFILNDSILCLDAMPYGDFLEIEGQKEHIKKVASQIGLQWEKRILLNYLAIFDIIRLKLNLPFNDVTFERFKNIRLDLEEYLDLLEAKRP